MTASPLDADLDLGTLERYLRSHLEGFEGPIEATAFGGGQSNPTYLLTTPSGRYVLRRQPSGELLPSAHAVDREWRVIDALARTDVPVPRALHLCEDRDVLGVLFYVMSHEQGRIFWNPAVPELDAEGRGAVYEVLATTLAAVHDVDLDAVGLADFGRAGSYFERQISRWSRQYRASETERIEAMDEVMDWLAGHAPPDDGTVALIHGDYRIDNLMFEPDAPRARALLDWELSTLGHPLADLSYQCMQLRLDPDDPLPGLAGLDRRALGIPTEAEYVARYCERRGLGGIPGWDTYLVFGFFRLAAILQGVRRRALDGNAASERAIAYGSLTPKLASMARELLDAA